MSRLSRLHRAFPASLLTIGLLGMPAAPAQEAPPLTEGTEVTLELIMSDPDWLARSPENPYWADDSNHVLFERKREGEQFNDLWRASLDGSVPLRLSDSELADVDAPDGDWSRDRRIKVYERDGDIFWKDVSSGETRQLTRTAESEGSPQLLLDGQVAYRRGQRVLVRDLTSGLESEPFDLRFEKEPTEKRTEEQLERDYLARQQHRLFEIVRERERRAEVSREREVEQRQANPRRNDLPWYLGEDVALGRALLSPTGRHLLVTLVPKKRDPGEPAKMPLWITDSSRIDVRDVRPTVGTGKPTPTRLLLLDRETHRWSELDLSEMPGVSEDPLSELRAKAEQRKAERAATARGKGDTESDLSAAEEKPEADAETQAKKKPRALRISNMSWNRTGTRAIFQASSHDNKDRWIATITPDPAAQVDGEGPIAVLHPVRRIHDPAWINWRYRQAGWYPDGDDLWYLSEESGFAQLYRVHFDGTGHRALTEGDFVVRDPVPTLSGEQLIVEANVDHPGIFEVFRVDLDRGGLERLTELGGVNRGWLSPDETKLLIEHSTTTRPPELYVQEARAGAAPRQITDTISEAFARRPWVTPQIVEVPSSESDRPIYSRLYRPQGPVPAGGRPAVLFVHGAGYLQNSHQGWSNYSREFMFHTLLVQHGYVVLDMDYRASAGYGRDWRTAIYRQMGTPEVEDLADGIDWLVTHLDVDRTRIGVYGGSYGGFLTLMAMFKQPELFAAGAALRPVTDWSHYNHGYTSNILNTPELDPEAYERSSPIEFAQGLEKPLLICSPMLDDNVFFLDSVRLVQRLIELEKEEWEIALFPVEPHGFREPSSWLDEYRRIFKLFQEHVGKEGH